jgi:acetyl esterase/lipase
MRLRQLAWMLEEKVWARRSYRHLMALNAAETPTIEEHEGRFGSDAHQVLFWFAPRAPTRLHLPVLFFVHGGGWQSGDPFWHRFVGRHLAQRGYLAIVVGYRLAPQFVIPAQLEDIHAAVELGMALARDRGWSGPAVLIGQSAGAHLAALLVYGGRRLLPAAVQRSPVRGLVLLGGPLSFGVCRDAALQAAIHALGGPERKPADLDPVAYVTGTESVAVLCVHGAKDYLVPEENSLVFTRQVNGNGGNKGEVLLLRRYHHADLIMLLYEASAEAERVCKWIAERV